MREQALRPDTPLHLRPRSSGGLARSSYCRRGSPLARPLVSGLSVGLQPRSAAVVRHRENLEAIREPHVDNVGAGPQDRRLRSRSHKGHSLRGSCLPTAPSRNPFVILASVFASFVGGPALGVAVAHWSAPGSELAQFVSPLAFALAFVAGLMLWFGLGVFSVLADALYRLLRGRWRVRRPSPPATEFVPPGYGAFLPVALGFGLLAGVVAGLVPQSTSFWSSCATHVAAGAAYGGLLRSLARHGYLPFPEPS